MKSQPCWLAPLLVAALSGCQEPPPSRVFLDLPVDTAFVFGGPADTTLLRMHALRPFLDGVVATDNDSGRIVFLGGDGALRWIYERRGQGPFEINRPWDVTESSDGTLYVLDANNLKLVELSATAEPLREERIPTLPSIPGGMVEVAPGQLLLMDQWSRGVAWRPWDGVEEPLVPLSYPDTMPARGVLRNLAYAEGSPEWGWVAGMRIGPRWWRIDPEGRVSDHDFVHRPGYRQLGELVDVGGGMQILNTPPQTSVHGALAMSVDEDGVWVLSGGGLGLFEGEGTGSIIDVYDGRTGNYRHSFRAPTPPTAINLEMAKRGGRLYFMYQDPETMILAVDIREE